MASICECPIYGTLKIALANFRSHWIVLPETLVPGRPLPLTFNFYNTTADIEVQVDLIQDTHTLISTVTHTFTNGKLSDIEECLYCVLLNAKLEV